MEDVLVFGSEDCPGWEETREVVDELKEDPGFSPSIHCLDPVEYQQKFREYGLVICPSVVYRDEVVAVGPPNFETIKDTIEEIDRTKP